MNNSSVVEAAEEALDIIEVATLKRWQDIEPRDLDESFAPKETPNHDVPPFTVNKVINTKIALWAGDLTQLRVDAIVNPTNETLSDRGRLSEKIVRKAGPQLSRYLKDEVKSCRTGEARWSPGYDLPCRYVIHTVGPKYNARYQTAAESVLHSSYRKVLAVFRELKIRTIGVCAIHSSRRGYPPKEGAHIALRTIRRFLEEFYQDDLVDCIVLALDDVDVGIYQLLMSLYFPRTPKEERYGQWHLPVGIGGPHGEPVIVERQIRIADHNPFWGDDDGSVDINARFDMSVAVGKTAFARMQGDLDQSRLSDNHPLDHLSSELARKNRYERLLRKARQTDFSSIERINCFYRTGVDRSGRPVYIFMGRHFRQRGVDMEKFLLYIIHTMDQVVNNDYVIIYFHTGTSADNYPPLSFIRYLYDVLDYRYKKHLRALYIVHPTWWTKVVSWWFATVNATALRDKIRNVSGVEYLYYVLAPDQLIVPQFVMDYDYSVNGARYCDLRGLNESL